MQKTDSGGYICPMCPGVSSDDPAACPKCGMALEPAVVLPPARTEFTCPMHPEVLSDEAGDCPLCGMALEPETVTLSTDNPELDDMTRRFWLAAAFTIPLVFVTMGDLLPGAPVSALISAEVRVYLELVLALPVCIWSAWPFYLRGLRSVATRNLNMFTLIALGVSVAFCTRLCFSFPPTPTLTYGSDLPLRSAALSPDAPLRCTVSVPSCCIRAGSSAGARILSKRVICPPP